MNYQPENDANEPAFPIVSENGNWTPSIGLTKREYFAAMAINGMISSKYVYKNVTIEMTAEMAVRQADALIEALNKTVKP